MALGDASSPIRFGQGQDGSDTRFLYLPVFGGEVLAAFDMAVIIGNRVETRSLRKAKSVDFPKTWKASSEYHTPGVELLGTDIDTTKVSITPDDILVAHFSVSDLDEMLSHFEVRSKFAAACGMELAKVYDKNTARQIILSARAAADGPFPGGTVITDASLTNTGTVDGAAWVDAIREARGDLFDKDVPDTLPLYMNVNRTVFDAMKYAKDAGGQYLVLNRDFNDLSNGGGIQSRAERLMIDGVEVRPTRNLPTADETADTAVYTKYRANYSTTTGILFAPMAVATVKVMDIGFETTRDTRRLEDFTVSKMLAGHGKLRPECAVEFKTA